MEINLKDRKVVVTGAGDGIGRALALAFAKAGAQVAGCARNERRLSSLAKEITGAGHLFLPADLTRMEDIQTFHDNVVETFGRLDVLVNNVGAVTKLKNFFELSDQDWQDSFNINLLAGAGRRRSTRCASRPRAPPHGRRRGARGGRAARAAALSGRTPTPRATRARRPRPGAAETRAWCPSGVHRRNGRSWATVDSSRLHDQPAGRQ